MTAPHRVQLSRAKGSTPPPAWPFPTWRGQPYKPPRQAKTKPAYPPAPDAPF